MATRSKKIKIEDFRQIADACGGIKSDMATKIGVDRNTITNWCKEDARYEAAIQDAQERFVDLAESNLRRLVAGIPLIQTDDKGHAQFAGWIERPSEAAILFVLKTRGKDRGYVERTEVKADVETTLKPRTLTPQEAKEYGIILEQKY